jgi:hypothetical protein
MQLGMGVGLKDRVAGFPYVSRTKGGAIRKYTEFKLMEL